jgi:hypothetical protein
MVDKNVPMKAPSEGLHSRPDEKDLASSIATQPAAGEAECPPPKFHHHQQGAGGGGETSAADPIGVTAKPNNKSFPQEEFHNLNG